MKHLLESLAALLALYCLGCGPNPQYCSRCETVVAQSERDERVRLIRGRCTVGGPTSTPAAPSASRQSDPGKRSAPGGRDHLRRLFGSDLNRWSLLRLGSAFRSQIDDLPGPLLVSGLGPTQGRRLDALAQAALARSQFPILLVPDGETAGEWRPREILVPYDGSPEAARALEPIGDLARWAGATLSVVARFKTRGTGARSPGDAPGAAVHRLPPARLAGMD